MSDFDAGAVLLRYRKAAGLNSRDAAARAGVAPRTIHNLEAEGYTPSDDAAKVIRALIPEDSPDRQAVAVAFLRRKCPDLAALAGLG